MIRLYPLDLKPDVERKTLIHDDDVFINARNFYRNNKDMRHHKIVVYKDGQPVYCLGYVKNIPANIDKHNPKVQMHISNYFDYDEKDDDLDYSYIDRYKLIVFEELEEYSYQISRIISRNSKDIKTVFLDNNAKLFFEDAEVFTSLDDMYDAHPEYKELRMLQGITEIKWDLQGFFRNIYPTVGIMNSLYWLKREFAYGEKNQDKTFYLIKQPVKENGLTALIAYVAGICRMLRVKHPNFIPMVDLSVMNDPNQFSKDNTIDVWTMFFKQVSPYTFKDLYDSRHVILDQNSNINLNPYFTEFIYTDQRINIKYGDIINFNDEVKEKIDSTLDRLFADSGKTLGVIARGSDYNAAKVKKYVPHGIGAKELLEKVKIRFKEDHFDHIYLATEDESIFDLFVSSELIDKLIYVDQDRINYQEEDKQEKLLLEIFADDKNDDSYNRSINYLTVLEGLVRCDAIMANVACGAVTYASGRDKSYDFFEVFNTR